MVNIKNKLLELYKSCVWVRQETLLYLFEKC
jgi:hypothetical protein